MGLISFKNTFNFQFSHSPSCEGIATILDLQMKILKQEHTQGRAAGKGEVTDEPEHFVPEPAFSTLWILPSLCPCVCWRISPLLRLWRAPDSLGSITKC